MDLLGSQPNADRKKRHPFLRDIPPHNQNSTAVWRSLLPVLILLRAHFCTIFFASCAAARAGKVDVLARAKELGAPLTADVCLAAAEGGDVPTIEAAVTLGAPLARQQVTDAWHRAIEKGRVEMMAWLREYDPKHCDWIGHRIVRPWRRVLGPCGRAARWGRLAALQWLRSSDRMHDLSHNYGRPVQINQNNGRTKHVFDDAFDVPQDQRPEQFDFMAMCNAGKSLHIKRSGFCFVRCAQRNAWMLMCAFARFRSISFCLFFVDTGPCPWTEAMAPHERGGTCGFAAGHGHLDVLRWLRSRNPPCPWSGETTLLAAKARPIEINRCMQKWRPRSVLLEDCSDHRMAHRRHPGPAARTLQNILHLGRWDTKKIEAVTADPY